MFDKVTKCLVDAVYIKDQEKQKKLFIARSLLPFATLLVSLSALAVSALSYLSNQEGLNVHIQRDETSAIDIVEPTDVELNLDIARGDAAFQATWNVSIVNTSLTAIIPITAIHIESMDAFGSGTLKNSDEIGAPGETGLHDPFGHDVDLPIGIKPGQVLKFTL